MVSGVYDALYRYTHNVYFVYKHTLAVLIESLGVATGNALGVPGSDEFADGVPNNSSSGFW